MSRRCTVSNPNAKAEYEVMAPRSRSLVPQMKWGEERKEGRGQLAGHWSKDNLQKQVFESEQSVELLVLCVCVWRGGISVNSPLS